jgi:hypothetical protein
VIFSIEVIIAFWLSIYLISWVDLAPMNTVRNIILKSMRGEGITSSQ